MAILLRLALFSIAIALASPVHFASHWDGSHASSDDSAASSSSTAFDDDDDGAPACGVVVPAAGVVVVDGFGEPTVSIAAATGLSAAPGVTGHPFRPPRV